MDNSAFQPEEREILETVRRFVARDVSPHVARFEREGVYPEGIVAQMKALGLFGIAVPQAYGGLGLRLPVFAGVLEKLSKGWSSLAAYVNSHCTVAYCISRFGTESQKARFLPGMAAGEIRAALCLTEPEAGSDLQAIRSVAAKDGDTYVLNGSKIYVTNGGRASLLLVLAKTDPQSEKPSRGMSLLLVPKELPGVSVTTEFHKMGFAQVETVGIALDRVPVPADLLVGGVEGKGFAQLMDALEVGRIAIAASAVGLGAAALAAAMRFAGERKTFGKVINQHQAIQLRLADMATQLVAARQITRLAAQEKERGNRADMASAMAKLFASEACAHIAQEALRVHGGHGYITDYQVERLLREATLYLVGEGTSDIQKLVISRRMLDGSEADVLGLP